MYLVLIETSGNQNYIFSTNKLKENIGASELTYQAGTQWVVSAVATQNKEVLTKDWKTPPELRKMLREEHPSIDQPNHNAEIIVAASGKALVLAKTPDIARSIISTVTKIALTTAPGLDVSGVYIEIRNWQEKGSLAKAVKQVHKEFERVRSRRPSPENRFLRLPIIADCAMSGLPASELEDSIANEKPKAISCVSAVKRNRTVTDQAVKRLQAIAQEIKLVKDINKLEELFDDMSWLAIVHADGNGLGQIFMNFDDYIGEDKSNRNYINKYREFSLTLDECTENAFRAALNVLPSNKVDLPIVPLIIGGDDLTVVCHGEYALQFTKVFLERFEEETKIHPEISSITNQVFGVGKLSACAGVAIVKRHFPFSVAYSLAESLIKSAKEVKRKVTKQGSNGKSPFPCSAIDFHILYDTSGIDLGVLRENLEPNATTKLYNRPYVVTIPNEGLIESNTDNDGQDIGMEWIQPRRWEILEKWVALTNNSEYLPSGQAHTLRAALYIDVPNAEAQYQLIQSRYPELKNLLKRDHQASLFHAEKIKDKDGGIKTFQITPFLDALDAKDFLESEHCEKSEDVREDAA
jgi:hypothetical protein